MSKAYGFVPSPYTKLETADKRMKIGEIPLWHSGNESD